VKLPQLKFFPAPLCKTTLHQKPCDSLDSVLMEAD